MDCNCETVMCGLIVIILISTLITVAIVIKNSERRGEESETLRVEESKPRARVIQSGDLI